MNDEAARFWMMRAEMDLAEKVKHFVLQKLRQ
jgi:hypothetical protein